MWYQNSLAFLLGVTALWTNPPWTKPTSSVNEIFAGWNITHFEWNAGSEVVWYEGEYVLQPTFPSRPQGGFSMYACPTTLENLTSMTLTYDVLYPDNFDWGNGGRLPGLYGGHTECSGGFPGNGCFSSHYMWRPDGLGESFLFLPLSLQLSTFCKLLPLTVCDIQNGVSLARGAFQFTTGEWNTMQQTVILNTFAADGTPLADGVISVSHGYDGVLSSKIHFEQVIWASTPNVVPMGLQFDTFYNLPNSVSQVIYFRNVIFSVQ